MTQMSRPVAVLGAAAVAGAVALHPGWRLAPWGRWTPASAVRSALRKPERADSAGSSGAALLPSLGLRRPTLVLFQSESSRLERQFVAGLRRDGPARSRDDLRLILLPGLDTPTARRFAIHETPTLLALQPGGQEISRRVGAEAITAALAATAPAAPPASAPPRTSSTCRLWLGPRLRWVEERDPRARRVYRRFGGGRWEVPDIFKAMSLRPDLMEKALDLSEMGHFSDGYLDQKTKQQIATYVSALNGSHYCVGSHAAGLRALGARTAEVAALAQGDLDGAGLSPHQRTLFAFLRRLTLKPGEVTDTDVKRLKAAGWRDEEIFEAAFDASLFAFFNRIAITYGLDYPPDGWIPRSSGNLPPHAASNPQLAARPLPPIHHAPASLHAAQVVTLPAAPRP